MTSVFCPGAGCCASARPDSGRSETFPNAFVRCIFVLHSRRSGSEGRCTSVCSPVPVQNGPGIDHAGKNKNAPDILVAGRMNDQEPACLPDITRLLVAWRRGEQQAFDQLTPLIYEELRRLASAYMRRERPDHTLQPTALVHEAYLRIAQLSDLQWEDRAHFFGIAAHLMRQILVQHARAHSTQKRGGEMKKLLLNEEIAASAEGSEELIALDDALRELEQKDPRKSKVLELKYFGGSLLQKSRMC
jgi:RNA polymerase sigma factor (TIGR02999 family)